MAAGSPEAKQEFVRRKFAAIAPRYDLLNTLLSFGVDAFWRRAAVARLPVERYPRVLDLCAGTLPLSLELARARGRRVTAADFCLEMLLRGKNRPGCNQNIEKICADGQRLPLKDESFDGLTVAFGVRNLAAVEVGLAEMYRVLRPGGRAVILEFSRPRGALFAPLYNLYLRRLLPLVGGLISGDREAYSYLASSIGVFLAPEELTAMLKAAGFAQVTYKPLSSGIVTLYTADKAPKEN